MGAWPITGADVASWPGIAPTATEQAALDVATLGVVALVNRVVLGSPDPVPAEVGDDIRQGAVMLAARIYGRRGTALGVVGTAELGTAYVMRNDPDIAMLLRLNRPQVG